MVKLCTICGNPVGDDHYKGTPQRHRECHKQAMRQNRAEKIEYYREYDRQRYQNDPRVKARHRRYQLTDAGKASAIKSKNKWIKNNPQKRQAHIALGNAVKRGRVEKPEECELCGDKPTRIEGHHHDYSKPLDVVWLCKPCHMLEHK